MAEARNYEQYRREVLDKLGVEYYDEDIQEFDKWRLKVLSGLKDLFTEENIIRAVEEWLEAHPEYYEVKTENIVDEAVTIPKLGNDVINKIENIPLASGTKVGGIKFGVAGDPPRPSARLTADWTPSYPNVSDVMFPLIRDDGTISAYYIPEATQTVKGAMSAEDKTKLDGIKLKNIYRGGGSPSNPFVGLEHDALSGANYGGSDFTNGTVTWLPYLVQDSSSNEYLKIPKRFLPEYKREVIKTVTSDENLHNTTRGVDIWYDGDALPEVNVYRERDVTTEGVTTVQGYKYDIVLVFRDVNNDHPEYGEHKATLWIFPKPFDSSTQVEVGCRFVVEHNANRVEGGNIQH